MNKPFIQIDAEYFTISGFDTQPLKGYKANKDFPNCCDFHKSVVIKANNWYKKFPNCCEPHKTLKNKRWFKKNNYKGIPQKIINQLSFTEYHIEKQINIPDWYKDIIDYIEYNINSFGHPPIGLDLYFEALKHYLLIVDWETLKVSKDKIQKLIKFIDDFNTPVSETTNTDLNVPYSVYQNWLSIFPFDIEYFRNLKQHFAKQMPFLKGKPEYNKYTGLAKGKIINQNELIEVIKNITTQLLNKIETKELINKGVITDINKHTIDLINESHRIKQYSLLNKFSEAEKNYIEILKNWLENEKNYFNEIAPLLILQPRTNQPKPELSLPQLALMFFYSGQKITRENGNVTAKQYGHNSGERLFQLYTKYSSRQNRIGIENTKKKNLNKIELFEIVITKLHEPLKQKAIDELNTLKAAYNNEYL